MLLIFPARPVCGDVSFSAGVKSNALGALKSRSCLLAVPGLDRVNALEQQLAALPRLLTGFGE
jgi:hypothetical protein